MMLRRLYGNCCWLTNLGRAWQHRGRTAHYGQQFSVSASCYSIPGRSSGSGDGEVVYVPGYEKVKELQQADENVRKMLSLQYASQQEHNKVTKASMIKKLQEREGDTGSTHVQIGSLTVRIQYLTEHMKKNRKDKSCLRSLVQLAHRRRKLLLSLKETDTDLYQRILQDLGLRQPTLHKYLQKRRKKK